MKRALLLLAAGLIAQQGFAAASDVEDLTIKAGNWNVSPVTSGVTTAISFSNGYGEFKLISSSISKTDYKGFKVGFSDLVDVEGGGVHLKIGKSVMDGTIDNGVFQYLNFADATDNVVTGEFAADLDDEIATFNVQCNKEGESVTITKFILIKNDGTEVEAEALGGVSWGCTAEPKTEVVGLAFSGQYGFAEIISKNGESLAYDPVTEKDIVYTYNFEFSDPLAGKVCFELDNASGSGFAWINGNVGDQSVSFEVSADKYPSTAVAKIYIKASADNDKDSDGDGKNDCYATPYTVKFKSITRTKVDNSIDETLNAYDILTNGQVILKSDLEKFNPEDKVVFTYSVTWDGEADFKGWGVGALRSGSDNTKDNVTLSAPAESGTCTYTTTVEDLLAICGKHAAEEGEGKDNTEWEGIYWFVWGCTNNDVTCTTTKVSAQVYSSNVISAIKDITPAATVVSTEYYSLTGAMSATPVKGINIIKQTLSDGTTRYAKKLVR